MREGAGKVLNGTDAKALNVIITGGSSGIGRSMVDIFCAAGHNVLFTYLSSTTDALTIENKWPTATKARLDQGEVASVLNFSETAAEWAGESGVQVLVNNAALGSGTVQKYLDEGVGGSLKRAHRGNTALAEMAMRAARDEALMRVNALGPLWVTDSVMDLLTVGADDAKGPGKATVIFIGSVGGGSAVFPEYCAADLMSKAATSYLSKHLAAQHVRDKVDILCIAPGATETDMFRRSTLANVADRKSFVDSLPKRRLLQPKEVASAVFWLAANSPPGIFHGACIDASMGLAVRPGLQTESSGKR